MDDGTDTMSTMHRNLTANPIARTGNASAAAPRAAIEVRLLGRFSVRVAGQEIPEQAWQRRKARQLFKCLLSRPFRRITRDEVIDALWPDSSPDAAAKTLRSTLHALRSVLRTSESTVADIFLMDDGVLAVHQDADIWVDADAFETMLQHAADEPDPLKWLEEADQLWTGEYLPDDLYEEWSRVRRDMLQRRGIELQFQLTSARLATGNVDGAVGALRRVLQIDSCSERATVALMKLMGAHGRRPEALRAYEDLVAELARIDAEPEASTRELRARIVEGQVPATEALSMSVRVDTGASSEVVKPGAKRTPAPPFPAYLFPEPRMLIGRSSELSALSALVAEARAGCRMAMLGAPAGSGKSTLIGQLVRRARDSGFATLAGGAYEQQAVIPLGPFRDALADALLSLPAAWVRTELEPVIPELATLVPSLASYLAVAPSSDETLDQARIFGAIEQCLRTLSSHWPLVLCIEDLHAADPSTLDCLRFLSRRVHRLPLLLVVSLRDDEVSPREPAGQLVAGLQREGATHISLPPFSPEETGCLVQALLDGLASPGLTRNLYASTGGNPLFVEQCVLALHEAGHVDQRHGLWEMRTGPVDTLTPVIRALLDARLARLSGSCLETLAMVAILGAEADSETLLAALHARPESQVYGDLEEALAANILRETASGFAFSHALLRESVYQALSGPRRVMLHARAAETLERLHTDRLEKVTAQLAYQLTRAGNAPETRVKAFHFCVAAGRQTAALGARHEALAHFREACRLLTMSDLSISEDDALSALEGCCIQEQWLGHWDAAASVAQSILERTSVPRRRLRAREVLGNALQQVGDLSGAMAQYEIAEQEAVSLPEDETGILLRMRLQGRKGYVWFLWGRPRDMEQVGAQMLETARALGQPRPLLEAHSLLASSCLLLGDINRRMEHSRRAHESALATGDATEIANAELSLAIGYYNGGSFSQARFHLEEALRLVRRVGADSRAVNPLRWLARTYLADGDLVQAYQTADLARAIALEANDRWVADCHQVLGEIYAARAEWDAAETELDLALALRNQIDHVAGRVETLLALGHVQERRGSWSQAAELYRSALHIARGIGPGPHLLASMRQLGALYLRSDRADAVPLLEQAMSIAETLPSSMESAAMLATRAILNWRREAPSALLAMGQAALERGLCVEVQGDLLVVMTRTALSVGDSSLARACRDRLADIAQRRGDPRLRGLERAARAEMVAREDWPEAEKLFLQAHQDLLDAGTPFDRTEVLATFAESISQYGHDRPRALRLNREAEMARRAVCGWSG